MVTAYFNLLCTSVTHLTGHPHVLHDASYCEIWPCRYRIRSGW